MRSERARLIMELLGWGQADVAREFNRVARTKLDRREVHKQISGVRDVSMGMAVFLRLQVRVRQLERREARRRGVGVV
jgi:hypothetical protein